MAGSDANSLGKSLEVLRRDLAAELAELLGGQVRSVGRLKDFVESVGSQFVEICYLGSRLNDAEYWFALAMGHTRLFPKASSPL